jgi:signal transduction histidine kinase
VMENKSVLKLVHDLNNLLCATTGFTEMLLDSEDREHQKKLLEINMDSLVKMANILDKTRIELLKEMRNDPI